MLPTEFSEALGGIALAFAILFTFFSLVTTLRPTATRLAAFLYLTAFALFSDHWATYFAAVFIIATAVTELEFLHILAAIIRGDKNYFDYRREFLTRDEIITRTDEFAPAAGPTDTTPMLSASGSRIEIPKNFNALTAAERKQLAFEVEDTALRWLERRLGQPLQRYVRLSSGRGSIELDGIVQDSASDKDTVAEVRWIPDGSAHATDVLPRVMELYARYKQITNRNCEVIFLAVVPTKESVPAEAIQSLMGQSFIATRVMVVTYDELGIESPAV